MRNAIREPGAPTYRSDLALVHHRGYGAHADLCAPGILERLEPIRARGGLVLELGCGSGRLTRHLLDAGHRVIATDASPSMLALASEAVPEADLRRLALPHDALPDADAIVAVGHVLNYLADEAAIERAWAAIARALRPRGLVAMDVCDLEYGATRASLPPHAQVTDEWAIVTRYALPSPTRFVRDITVFVREQGDRWRRDDERHENVLLDTATIPALLARHGIEATVRLSFGTERLPAGLKVLVGERAASR